MDLCFEYTLLSLCVYQCCDIACVSWCGVSTNFDRPTTICWSEDQMSFLEIHSTVYTESGVTKNTCFICRMNHKERTQRMWSIMGDQLIMSNRARFSSNSNKLIQIITWREFDDILDFSKLVNLLPRVVLILTLYGSLGSFVNSLEWSSGVGHHVSWILD